MKIYVLLFIFFTCISLEGKPDRNCRSARLEAKEKYLKRKKDHAEKYAWLLNNQ